MTASAEFVAHITQSQQQLHAFILSIIWNPTDADDVLQETNLVLWGKAAEFDANRPFLPWAMRFAQWQARAWLKRHRRQQLRDVFDEELIQLLADEAVAEEQVFEARRHALASCLQKIRPEQRELIARRYSPDASVDSMAKAGRTTPKAVSDKLRRIRHGLLECIQKSLVEESHA
ncbi:MAG: sigma-70 family RNA polymerase sigma factor [Planctomycetota bacterium]